MCEALECIPDGQSCAFGDQCCSGVCVPDPRTGELVCNPDCSANELSCTTNSDCCGGYCNPETMACAPPPGDCIPALGPCMVDADCCDGLMCIDGICSINPM
jgi:hypothetical protein